MHCSTLQANCCSVFLCKASCQLSTPTELASIRICSLQKCGHQAPMQCSTTHQELLLTHVCNPQAPMHCSTLQVNCCSVLLCKASCQLSTPTELASIRICSLHKCATPKHQCNEALSFKSCYSIMCATPKHQRTAAPCRPIAVLCYCAKQAANYQLRQNLHLSGSALYTSVVTKHQCNAALPIKSCCSLMCATTKHQWLYLGFRVWGLGFREQHSNSGQPTARGVLLCYLW